MKTAPLPTLFIPHGAGPCFFMDWEPADTWDRMAEWLRTIPQRLGRTPSALLVISAHWETAQHSLSAQATPPLLYDYHGFPAHTYALRYPVPGSPVLAARVQALLAQAGVAAGLERERGIDHGVFIPLMLIYPEAEVPVVQLSLRQGLDPAWHLALGRALLPLRREGVLIIGSGMSYHNMQRFRQGKSDPDPDSVRFDAWLTDTVALAAPERERRLIAWADAPGGRAAHPREEHLLPLHVVAGAAGDAPGRRVFEDRVLGSVQSAFLFGAA
jgi:aromatic ring-opening dioxygenase catalytic subunit (LigB family)